MLLLLISFFAGILTILAPCVLPLLPVIVGGSVNSDARDKSRPYVIAGALAGSIIVFTLLLKVSTVLIGLSPNILNYISGTILVALGITSVLPELWEKLIIAVNWQAASQRFLGRTERNPNKYVGAILVGVAIGPVFASCSPTYAFILASVLPHSFASGLIYLVAYSIGLVLALLAVSLAGRKFMKRFAWAVDTHSSFRRIIGILFVIIGLVIFAGKEVPIETWVGNHLPFDETRIERVLLAKQHKSNLIKQLATSASNASVLNVQPQPAPEFAGLTNWINGPPQTIAGNRGKVVLVDFWTFSCINCIRTIPYLEKWEQTYAKDGLVIVGVNTPEFAFEHDPNNVAAAVKKFGITYPVALDNDYGTWNAYGNDSWPADYLVDKQGDVRYVSLGEGDYDKTERAIQELLGVNKPLTTPTSTVPITSSQTPETYFGTNRAANFAGTPSETAGTNTYTAAASLAANQWTLNGSWQVDQEYITSESDTSTLTFHVDAKDVYVIANPPAGTTSTIGVGLPSDAGSQYATDAPKGSLTVDSDRLYHIVSLPKAGETTVTLTVPKGTELYTFTFGS